ncbi:hypothetical protein SZ09_20115, partial [Vibrio parahaemolyticus]
PSNDLREKLKRNVEEGRARGCLLYVFADAAAGFEGDETMKNITMPLVRAITAAIYYTIPMQLLSYYVALIKGTDVDQTRNLAKAATVE